MPDFKQWCKDAGPLGPGLWIFDKVVDGLSSVEIEQESDEEDLDDFGISLAIFIFLLAIVGGLSFLIWG